MGELVPIMAHEVLPGDVHQHQTDMLVRVAPMLTPVMHPTNISIHHFYVPSRIVWKDFEDFITGGDDGNDTSVFPQITLTATEGSLADYLGIPIGTSLAVNALVFRAYALIWNHYFRDKDLQTELTIDLTSGADSTTNTALQFRCWEKDFFTTCRATEQKGSDVTLPLGTSAPVLGIGVGSSVTYPNTNSGIKDANTDPAESGDWTADTGFYVKGTGSGDVVPDIRADLSNATAATVNQLRSALAEQSFKEARSRYGNDYRDYLKWLGVGSVDGRLQRPEYLGGGKNTITFSEIIQSGTDFDSNDGVGTLRGHGMAGMRSNRYKKFFPEHGYVISLASAMPKTMYSDGIHHMFNKTTKEEFFQREYQHTGQRAVKNKEVYAAHTTPRS